MDSCSKDSLAFFSESRVIKTPNQDETDFTKTLHVLTPFIEQLKLEYIIALCETSGRIDQILGNINSEFVIWFKRVKVKIDLVLALHKNNLKPPEVSRPVFILSDNSISWLLSTGQHEIHIPESVRKLWCAMIPFRQTTVTTTGLKWNLTNGLMQFGGVVSTSNTYDVNEHIVTITTDQPILWSMGTSNVD